MSEVGPAADTTARVRLVAAGDSAQPIAAKLARAIGDVSRIGRDGTNEFHKYNYTSAEQVYRVVRGPLLEQGLVVIPSTSSWSRQGQNMILDLELTILDTNTGESLTARWVGEGADKGDKATYKAATGGMKTWLKHLFLLPADDDPESDPETDRRADLLDRLKTAANSAGLSKDDRRTVATWMNDGGDLPKMNRLLKAVELLESGKADVLAETVARS
jgi:hypothetical protein